MLIECPFWSALFEEWGYYSELHLITDFLELKNLIMTIGLLRAFIN